MRKGGELNKENDNDMLVMNNIVFSNVVEQKNLPVFKYMIIQGWGEGILLLSDRGKSLPAVDSIVLFWATNTTRFVD